MRSDPELVTAAILHTNFKPGGPVMMSLDMARKMFQVSNNVRILRNDEKYVITV